MASFNYSGETLGCVYASMISKVMSSSLTKLIQNNHSVSLFFLFAFFFNYKVFWKAFLFKMCEGLFDSIL